MAKADSMNPAMAQHRKDKERVLKKAKAERQLQRNEKLARQNPFRIEKQIKQLQHKQEVEPNNWTPSNSSELDDLQDLLIQVKAAREKVGVKAQVQQNQQFDEKRRPPPGRERDSIFWDPVFNYKGIAPFGYEYIPFDRDAFDSEDESEMQIPSYVANIPLPNGPPPKMNRTGVSATEATTTTTTAPSRTTYEAAPVVRNLTEEATKLVPVSVLSKTRIKNVEVTPDTNSDSNRSPIEKQRVRELEEMAEYASEEEEALFGVGRKAQEDISDPKPNDINE